MDAPRPEPTPTIAFARSPAAVTLGEALGLAWRYWLASWERWLLAVVAVGLASGLATLLLGTGRLSQETMAQAIVPGGIDPTAAPALLAGPLAVGIVTLVAEWFLYANAIAGLRGGDLSLGRILVAGLRTLAVLLVLTPALLLLFVAIALLGPAGGLLLLAMLPLVLIVGLRLSFWMLVVFEGRGVVESLQSSWAMSRGALLRIFGWQLALVGLSLITSIVTFVAFAALGALPAIPAAISAGVATAFSAWSLIAIAILYESQRLRLIEGAPSVARWDTPAAVPPGWGQPGANPTPGPDADPPRDPDGPSPPPAGR